jgi:hypothetical protein
MPMTEVVGFIRVTKIIVLAAGILTGAFIVFVVGWQITTFVEQGSWSSPTISSAREILNQNHSHNYVTQATRNIGHADAGGLVGALLSLPIIAPLIIAAVLLSAFYVYLTRIDRQYSGN